MKRKLIFAMLCIVSVLGLRAQSWVSPGSDPVNGESYYIMNVEAGQFITAANDWGTQLSATGTSDGLLIRTNEVTNVSVAGASLSGWQLVNTNNSNKLLFRDSQNWGYTDKGNQDRGYVWNVTKVNGVYRLQTATGDPAYPSAALQYAGVNTAYNNARVYFGYNSSSADIDWIFLTSDQKNATNVKERAKLYRALMKAYAAGVNTDAASAVYENGSSSADELNAATTSLNEARFAAHLANASNGDPRDVTEFVLNNSDFTKGNITGWETNYVSGTQATNIGYQDNNTYQTATAFCSRFIEAWRSGNNKIGDGYLRQTVSSLPEGKYVLECDAIATNQGNTSATTTGALLYINADGVDFKTSLSTNGGNPQHFSTEFLFTGVGDVIFGLKTENTTANWIAADNFKVTFYGIDLSAYVTQLGQAVDAFEALEGSVPTAAYNDKKTNVLDVYNQTWSSSSQYSTAISAIQAATTDLNALATVYAQYQTVRAAVLAAYASTDVTSADAAANAATTTSAINDAITSLRDALKTALASGSATDVDLTTVFLTNPSFETGDFSGWSNTGMALQGNTSFGKDGSYYAECWEPNGTKSVYQTITGMPAGIYQVSVKAKARGVTSAKVSAGGVDMNVKVADEENTYVVKFACDANADITFGYEGVGTGAGTSWLCVDNFSMTFIGTYPTLPAVEGKMTPSVYAAQTDPIATYNAEKNATNYNAAIAVINAAQASKDAYTAANAAIAKANALKDAHNFASAAATTTFTNAIATAQTSYDESSLTTDQANAVGTTLGVSQSGWHGNNDGAAPVYLRDGFALGDFEDDPALHVNTWSNEGDNDGSGFSVPFYESWTTDANSLPNSTLSGTLTGLPNGLYSIQAWVRVRSNNSTEATAATGITMDVNGGGVGDYAPVDVTEGSQVGESRFNIGTYTAQGLVKNGNLTLNFNIADANISWLSFKNIKYTKLRDLTPEEAAVVPADLSLAATSTVYKGRTTTLTPTSTTDGASIEGFVNWSSDNEAVATVANGVVTGVAYGTANITVTSTLNGEATATCAVTVTAPLITEAENLDFASGPVVENHIRTYAKDKTGTDVAQMQEVSGWTFGVANGDAKAAGVMAYGSSYGMGSDSSGFYAPATNPNGEATGNALGMVGVWTGSVQYVQNVKLPVGAYTITVPVYRNGGSSALTKNLIGVILDDETEHLATTKTYASGSWTTETIEFTITSETYGKLSIGLNAPNQGSGNSQRLWIDGMTITYEPFATAEEIAALNSAITTAEAKTLGFEDGEYAPYSNIEVLTTLANAKALDKENPVAQSVVTGATTILNNSWNQNVGDVDAIYNGLYATVTDGANYPKGWKRTNGWGQMRSGIEGIYATAYYNQPGSLQYGNQGLYTMPLAANTIYRLTFAYRSHENNSNYSMKASVLNEGSEGLSEIEFGGNGSTSDWKLVSQRFRTGAAGNYVLTLANGGNTWMTNVSLVKENSAANITINETVTFVPQADPLANVHLARAIKADKWNSIVLPFDVDNTDLKAAFGSDVQVAEFSETADGTSSTINFATMVTPAIEANKPVLLKTSTAGTEYDFTDRTIEVGEAKVTGNGNFNFIGTYDASFTVPANDYFISSNTLYKSKGATTLKGTRAYLENLGATEVKMFIDDLETSINGLMADDEENGPVYNLAGQRVQKAQKGIFVKNGRKVVVK